MAQATDEWNALGDALDAVDLHNLSCMSCLMLSSTLDATKDEVRARIAALPERCSVANWRTFGEQLSSVDTEGFTRMLEVAKAATTGQRDMVDFLAWFHARVGLPLEILN